MINYATLSVVGSAALQVYPAWTWSLVAPFKREIRDVQRLQQRGKELLMPLIQERHEKMQADQSWEPPEDFITWVSQSSKAGPWDPLTQIQSQMGIGLAAIHTT